mmetsp:Transcript_10830/g.23294  ORF Transcript_10830/g.23294 Transcript_10830/m.23294 type:complete len:157 (-) Transcript_10830:527-997(-)
MTSTGSASSVEVYGFAGYILSAFAFGLFLLWAYLPEKALVAVGVTYYPDKQWAVILPGWLLIALAFALFVYESVNQVHAKPFSSMHTVHDVSSKSYKQLGLVGLTSRKAGVDGWTTLPLVHIPAPVVSRVLYGSRTVRKALLEEDAWLQASSAQRT